MARGGVKKSLRVPHGCITADWSQKFTNQKQKVVTTLPSWVNAKPL